MNKDGARGQNLGHLKSGFSFYQTYADSTFLYQHLLRHIWTIGIIHC